MQVFPPSSGLWKRWFCHYLVGLKLTVLMHYSNLDLLTQQIKCRIKTAAALPRDTRMMHARSIFLNKQPSMPLNLGARCNGVCFSAKVRKGAKGAKESWLLGEAKTAGQASWEAWPKCSSF
ncbi:hypothetical protein CsSME_00035871 [Camellia sinensis var. sinensis]